MQDITIRLGMGKGCVKWCRSQKPWPGCLWSASRCNTHKYTYRMYIGE